MPRREIRERIGVAIRFLNLVWAGYAFYETLDNLASDYRGELWKATRTSLLL